jgi:hypothetical protein
MSKPRRRRCTDCRELTDPADLRDWMGEHEWPEGSGKMIEVVEETLCPDCWEAANEPCDEYDEEQEQFEIWAGMN